PVGSPLTLDGRPKIRIIDVKGSKYQDMSISSELVKEAKRIVSNGERLLFLVNRKGYSLIRCDDCGDILKCSKCRMSLVFHKGAGQVRCHYCGFSGKVADTCENCKGANVKPFGAGTERVKEEVEGLLKTEALLIEKNGNQAKIFAEHAPDFTPFVIGTSFAKRLANKKNVPTEASDENSGSGKGAFSAVAFLNMDALLSQPDFRLYERAFQEIAQVAQMVRTDGTIYLQTRMPKNRVLRFIKNYDFDGFYKYELSQRRALDYPPLSKIILINVFMKKEHAEALRHIEGIAVSGAESVEILGPVEIPSSVKSYSHCIQLMLKSRDRKMLHNTAKELLSRIGKLKGIKVNTDVDPLKI
ncbi:MAG: hypothetical protein HY099_02560, partial [Nitrospirae bacterium]|nr:hypothetical protein [Nitrospirota bacterium]